MNPDDLLRHLESLLFVAAEPADITQLAGALDVSADEVESALGELAERGKWRGIRVQRRGQRVQFASAPEAAPYVEKFLGLTATTRLSQAALETLAIIAYRQPITRPEIEVLRGVDCDGVLRTLTARQLITEVGRLDTVGHPIRYGTTFEFLRYFGLERLEQMPSLQLPGEAHPAATDVNTPTVSDRITQQEPNANERQTPASSNSEQATDRREPAVIAVPSEIAQPGGATTAEEAEDAAGHLATNIEAGAASGQAVDLDEHEPGATGGASVQPEPKTEQASVRDGFVAASADIAKVEGAPDDRITTSSDAAAVNFAAEPALPANGPAGDGAPNAGEERHAALSAAIDGTNTGAAGGRFDERPETGRNEPAGGGGPHTSEA